MGQSMRLAAGSAFGIGMLAAAAISVLLWLTRALGLGAHLLIGGLLAVAYAAVFEAWRRAGFARGIAIAVPHAFLSGILLGFLPAIQPAIAENPALRPAGFLAVNLGWMSVALFFLLHAIYGAIVGAAYRVRPPGMARPVGHRRTTARHRSSG